jgi:hypothetical protein
MSIADLLPAVRSILPLNNVDALNRMCSTLCDVVERTLAVPPPPVNQNVSEIEKNRVARNAVVVAPVLIPTEFLHEMLLDGPRPAKAVERAARERHGWHSRILFKARRALRVKAMRRGFGPGGHWIWKLPEDATDRAIYFRPDEWRGFIAGHRGWPSAAG